MINEKVLQIWFKRCEFTRSLRHIFDNKRKPLSNLNSTSQIERHKLNDEQLNELNRLLYVVNSSAERIEEGLKEIENMFDK